ncbi:MAG: hypothetical protein GX285_02895 [Clostridiales bacterium]|nr:hypothetical protein [Clostridiales bacterium]
MDKFLVKLKLKSLGKKCKRSIKVFFSLPHLLITLVVIILAVITLLISSHLQEKDPFASSVLSNVFAGLVTGIVLCIISSIKAVSLYRTERILSWLDDLHSDFLKFNELHHKLLSTKKEDFNSEKEFNDFAYDVLCAGNDITSKISQNQFDTSLPFNTYKYCKRHFEYDAAIFLEENAKIREAVMNLDFNTTTQKELRKTFDAIEKSLFALNRKIIAKTRELNAKKNALSSSFV